MFTIARLFTFVLVLSFAAAASAADISCRDPKALGSIIPESPSSRDYPGWSPFRWSGTGDGGCFIADLNGKITSGDVDKLEWLLNGYESAYPKPGYVHRIYLSSPGGNVREAMTMGRMLRVARVSTETGCRANTVCCASACALIYYGGASWRPLDRLGWHRPSREDADDIEYIDSKTSMVIVDALIKTYFADMEIPTPIYDVMMRTPPDQIAIVQVVNEPRYEQHVAFPPSINDWLLAKCQNEEPDTLFMCMDYELRTPDAISDDEVKQYVWFSGKTAEQLRALLESSRPVPLGEYRRIAAEHELELRTGKQDISRP